jgi:flagellar biosynthesis component FlhA
MSEKIEKYTFGTLPTVIEIEVPTHVPIPTPFIPFWAKCLIVIFGVAIGILLYNLVTNHYEKKKRDKDDAKKNEANEYEKAQQSKDLAKTQKDLAEFQEKYRTKTAN